MSGVLLRKWLQQTEGRYISDIPFLFSLFFIILAFGKFMDLFYYLIYFHYNNTLFMIILKIRFILMWLNMIPLFLKTFEVWLFSLSLKDRHILSKKIKTTKLSLNNYLQTTKYKVITLIVTFEILITLLVPNIETISYLIVLAIPSFLLVSWLFYKAYQLKRLHKVNTLMLSIGFLIYSISTITRILWQLIFGRTVLYIFISEISDVMIFAIIFYGLLNRH
ncbi:hypothetical protein LCGC14_2224170 [marine sediment metagenome]|uniref:Uncharacterized protein n=1 Tax=marine sediment metagenome TaxID=412755 RepID=A0A0F9DXK5_9ZZZZ